MSDNDKPADDLTAIFGEIIHSYSRAQAIADGFLIDLTELAKEAGIRFPVAITSAAYGEVVNFDAEQLKGHGQDIEGRAWDVLTMFKHAARKVSGSTMFFSVLVLDNDGVRRNHNLKAVIGPGDDPAPVITVMLPN